MKAPGAACGPSTRAGVGPERATAPGGWGVRAPLHPAADALSLFHLTPNAITEEE